MRRVISGPSEAKACNVSKVQKKPKSRWDSTESAMLGEEGGNYVRVRGKEDLAK